MGHRISTLLLGVVNLVNFPIQIRHDLSNTSVYFLHLCLVTRIRPFDQDAPVVPHLTDDTLRLLAQPDQFGKRLLLSKRLHITMIA